MNRVRPAILLLLIGVKEIEPCHRDGAGIWFKPADGLDVKICFKRAS